MSEIMHLLDSLHIEDLQNDAHPSIFDVNEGYDMFIVRLPNIEAALEVESTGFILTPSTSYLYDRDSKKLQLLEHRFDTPYRIIDHRLDKLLNSFGKVQDTVLDMEETLYSNDPHHTFMTNWFNLKKDVIRIERIMLRTSKTTSEFIRHYETTENFPINHYADLHEHMERVLRAATLQLLKLDNLYTFYSARTNDKINRLIYILTIISAIFLPLNLIVGFFGMNTSGLPFSQGSSGTLNAIVLMLSLVILSSGIFIFWKRRYIH